MIVQQGNKELQDSIIKRLLHKCNYSSQYIIFHKVAQGNINTAVAVS